MLQALLVDSMSKLNDPLVQQFTSTNSVDVEALLRPEEGKPPWVVCVNMHLNLNTYQLLTPAFESAFEVWHEAIKYAKVHSPDVHSNDIFIVMDEAKNIAVNSSSGKVHPNITEIVDVMRSHGERGLFSTQSPDPRVLDPELLGKVTLLVGTPDDDTAKYVAEKAGITTRDLSTSSRTLQSMISGESGVEVLDIGWGSTGTRSSQWRDIIELTWGSTAREVPLIYPHNLTQMPRDLGIMIVPGFAPALYVPLNPRTSIVLQAMRRLEPVVEKGPIVDSHTPRDMAVQLAAPQPPDTHVAVGQASLSYSDDSAQELEELQGERQFLEEEEQGVAQPEEAAVLDQLAKEVAAAIEMQRQYKEAEEDTAQESGRPPAGR